MPCSTRSPKTSGNELANPCAAVTALQLKHASTVVPFLLSTSTALPAARLQMLYSSVKPKLASTL
eukprot:5214-Heterococcus_DN1.PRE.2